MAHVKKKNLEEKKVWNYMSLPEVLYCHVSSCLDFPQSVKNFS